MKKDEIITYKDPKSPISEIFRTLRTNLQFMTSNNGLKTLLVTSNMPGEGKSWVSANLIMTFAQEGKKVLVIDADMRKGRLHSIFEVEKSPGLSNYLSGVSYIEEKDKDNLLNYIKQTNIENLYVMPSGDAPPNPSELLVSDRAVELIKSVKNMFDIVIFDGTPALIVTDSVILARQVDATLIVTAYKETKLGDVEKIKKAIENVGGKIAGIVINKIPISARKYENSYYYGGKRRSKYYENEDKQDEEKSETLEEINAQIEKEIQEFNEHEKEDNKEENGKKDKKEDETE